MNKIYMCLFSSSLIILSFVLPSTSQGLESQFQKKLGTAPPPVGSNSVSNIPRPDLIIPPCRVDYVGNLCAGAQSGGFAIYRNVKNQGTKDFVAQPNQTLVKYWQTDADGRSDGSLTGNGMILYAPVNGLLLSPGQEYGFMYDRFCIANKKPGTYSYTYVVDPGNTVVESTKMNNTTTCLFVVTNEMVNPAITFDLAVEQIKAFSSPHAQGTPPSYIGFNISVVNVGGIEAPPFEVRCSL